MASTRSPLNRTPLQRYRTYVARLGALVSTPATTRSWREQINSALDGEAGAQLRELVPVGVRRKYGAFFTGTELSAKLLKESRSRGLTYDPACGMGDLLVAAARTLPLGRDLAATLRLWGRQLAGTDPHKEFITGTKTRLVLLARQRHKETDAAPAVLIDRLFPLIRVGDGLREIKKYRQANRLLMNPPFGKKYAPKGCPWGRGKISRAAEFIIHALEQMRPGNELLGILPDVLRSGTFSAKWREQVSALAEVHFLKACGLFDESTDVDVFLLRLVRRSDSDQARSKLWPRSRRSPTARVGDHFTISVGRVVPHRDLEKGLLYPYIHARVVPTWKTVRHFSEYRRHEAPAFRAPFVVIRRTSRPEHPHRATGSIIGGTQLIAVENHLIVCTPKDGRLRTCRRLLQQLLLPSVNDRLNRRIRCRHLTVSAVKEISFSPVRVKSVLNGI